MTDMMNNKATARKSIASGLFEAGFTPRDALALATEPYVTIDDVGEPAQRDYCPTLWVLQ